MPVRRLALAIFTALVVLGAAVPASAAPHPSNGVRRMLRLLHAQSSIAAVAVRDIDNDGDLDIVASPRQGAGLMVWRNHGRGRFALARMPHAHDRIVPGAPRFRDVRQPDDESGQYGDDRYDAAMPRAPAPAAAIVPLALVRPPAADFVRPAASLPVSGRAPPLS